MRARARARVRVRARLTPGSIFLWGFFFGAASLFVAAAEMAATACGSSNACVYCIWSSLYICDVVM